MPNFKITLQRRVVEYEDVERIIEADDEADAYAKAEKMADGFNSDCPGDAEVIATECEDWSAHDAQPTDEAVDEDDDGCPVSDPDCLGNNGDCHDACESPVNDSSLAEAAGDSFETIMGRVAPLP